MTQLEKVKRALIVAGVKNLYEFGYHDVTKENITTVPVFKAFFKRMLEGTIEEAKGTPTITKACNELISEMGV